MTVQEMIEKYGIRDNHDGRMRITNHSEITDTIMAEIAAKKPEILAYLKEQERIKEEKYQAYKTKVAAIPGLRELEDAIRAKDEYHDAFNRMMDSENGRMPKRPKVDVQALREKYPRANAYLIASARLNSANYELASIGQKALNAIIDGEDYEAALADMERRTKEFTDRHMWD